MPTLRLSDQDKNRIDSEFGMVINKAQNNHPFPIDEETFREWWVDRMPVNCAKAWRELRQWKPDLLRTGGYVSYLDVINNKKEIYKLNTIGVSRIPDIEPTVVEGDELHDELCKWASEYWDTAEKIRIACFYVERAIWSCTSAGQILRVLPEECVQFLPSKVTFSFAHAERKSRIPRDFTPNEETADLVLNMLALGSISPDHSGVHVEVARVENEVTENL